MIPRIDAIDGPPEVGRYYLVPCATLDSGEIRPVLLPAHADPELGVPQKHFHNDTRFLTLDAEGKMWALANIIAERPWCRPTAVEIKWRRRKCRRAMQLIWPTNTHPLYLKMVRKYADARLGDRCPHRGFPTALMPIENGARVCPWHGLRWCVRTGRLVT